MKQQTAVFWHKHDDFKYQKWLSSEFLYGRLRQGWGPPGSSLLENGLRVPLEKWRTRYIEGIRKHWKKISDEEFNDYRAKCDRRFKILSTMTQLRPGDLIVVPLMPDENQDSIVQLEHGYQFHVVNGEKDFGHILPVDPKSILSHPI